MCARLRVWTLSLVANICKMVQTKLTGFLSPPPRPCRDQSQSTPPPGQASPIGRPQSSPDLPKHVKKKSKRVLKAERKRERKRAKLQRACKNNNVSPVPSQITPMPSPNHCDEPVRNSCDCNSVSALTIKPWLGAERLLLVSDLNTNKTTTTITITSGLGRLGFYMDHRVTGSCWRDSWA